MPNPRQSEKAIMFVTWGWKWWSVMLQRHITSDVAGVTRPWQADWQQTAAHVGVNRWHCRCTAVALRHGMDWMLSDRLTSASEHTRPDHRHVVVRQARRWGDICSGVTVTRQLPQEPSYITCHVYLSI